MWNITLALVNRWNKTFRKYWRVVVPVHLISSSIWFGGCYYASEKGYTIVHCLEKLKIKEEIVNFFTQSNMGHLTITFALYKLMTPFRYITTFITSIYLIRYFTKAGLIKPHKRRKKKKPTKKLK